MTAAKAMKVYDRTYGYSLEAEKSGDMRLVRLMDAMQYAYSRFLKAAAL